MKKRKTLSPLKQWENLTLADNFIFCKVMAENPDVCKELLELLLDIKIEKVEVIDKEKYLKSTFDSKAVRFDVYAKDGNGRSFDLEIQTTHSTTLAKRARYYQGLMDIDSLKQGDNYSELKESYVIFLCLGDAFKKSLPVYTFRYSCDEDDSIKMNDGTVNIFFNAKNYDRMKSKELKAFFKFLCGKKAESGFTDRLSALVDKIKNNTEWLEGFMTWDQEINIRIKENRDEAYQEGYDEAYEERCIQTAQRMLECDISFETVAKCTGLPLAQVQELKDSLETVKV